MTRILRVEPEAEAELEEAITWYELRRRGLGLEFARVVRAGFAAVARIPVASTEVRSHIRHLVVRRFPYALYRVWHPELISNLVVFHPRRGLRVWHGRE